MLDAFVEQQRRYAVAEPAASRALDWGRPFREGQRPLRRQKLPLLVHPNGHVPLAPRGTASWAPWLGTQYEPLVK